MERPAFTNVLQVAVVVRDLDEAVRRYWDHFGIGPWSIYTIDHSQREMIVNDEPRSYSFRMALCDVGNVNWELVQPLDDATTFAEFLRTRGEGVHHVCFAVSDPAAMLENARRLSPRGIGVVGSGTWDGGNGSVRYTYLDTEAELGVIAEFWEPSGGFTQPVPDEVYPPTPVETVLP